MFRLSIISFLAIVLSGCASNSVLKTESHSGAKTGPYQKILVLTSNIKFQKTQGNKLLIESSQRKMVEVDQLIVKKLNALGVQAIHQTGEFSQQKFLELKKQHPEVDAILVNTFKSKNDLKSKHASTSRIKLAYVLLDTVRNEKIATLNADLKSSVDLLFNVSDINADDIIKELRLNTLICC